MTCRADFHTHSTASDGVLTPTQLVDLGVSRGVQIMALTDHDSVEGVAEAQRAAARHPGFTLVPGVEVSTDIPGNEVHVLGYFLDPEHPELLATLKRLRDSRLERGRRMVQKLHDLGYDIAWEQVQEIAGDSAVGRPHVAAALLEKGHITNVSEAFNGFIGRNDPAYVEREKMTPAEAVSAIVRLGGVAVLAHPADLNSLDDLLVELKEAGLTGMEVYYQDYDESIIRRLLETARRHDLFPLGGTDYHGIYGERERLPGEVPIPDEAIEAFMALGQRIASARKP
jgi:predicted metal-dependent phosphoesterase TrpH